ncbi:MAG TPA: type II toxin-antitoxin system VapC family toxin [Candidatus Nanoarchaeia archaeon]|nr:type II toxin-antitoxin system VapC family toxin [Candidatus Nanoarchaeia archaeon]
MQPILDTSIVIEIERENKAVIEKIEQLKDIYSALPKISFMTYFELFEGISKKSEKNKEKALMLINLFEVMQTTKKTAQILILLREKYELPLPDLFIAAQTLEHGGILVTKDTDFKSIQEIEKIILSD